MVVMIIEQDRDLLNSLERYFSNTGHKVHSFSDPVNAFNGFDEKTNLLIIDENLPRIKYSEIAEILKKKNPKMRIILLLDNFVIDKKMLFKNNIIDDFVTHSVKSEYFDKLLDILNMEKSNEPFLTFKEQIVLNSFIENDEISHNEIYAKYKENIASFFLCVDSLNLKLKDRNIIKTEKGLKMVNKND